MIYGSRNSLIFGLLSPVFAAFIGTTLGVTAGYFGGVTDRVISGVVDMLMAQWSASSIRIEATLSFLGILTQAPNPSWGNIIRDGLTNMFATQWPIIAGGLAITIVVLAISILGDSVRDVLDPENGK